MSPAQVHCALRWGHTIYVYVQWPGGTSVILEQCTHTSSLCSCSCAHSEACSRTVYDCCIPQTQRIMDWGTEPPWLALYRVIAVTAVITIIDHSDHMMQCQSINTRFYCTFLIHWIHSKPMVSVNRNFIPNYQYTVSVLCTVILFFMRSFDCIQYYFLMCFSTLIHHLIIHPVLTRSMRDSTLSVFFYCMQLFCGQLAVWVALYCKHQYLYTETNQGSLKHDDEMASPGLKLYYCLGSARASRWYLAQA